MNIQSKSDNTQQGIQQAEAAALQAELDALNGDMKATLPNMQSHAKETEKEILSDLTNLEKDVKKMDTELTAAEKDAIKHMDTVDEI